MRARWRNCINGGSAMTRHAITVPDFSMPGQTILVTAWLASIGDLVVEGDRVVEVLVGAATIDLESPVTGTLAEKLVAVDEPIAVGQVLGTVTAR